MAVTRAEMNRLFKGLRGPVRRAFERAIQDAQVRANIAAIVRAVEGQDIAAISGHAGISEGMWSELTEEIRTAYAKTGAFVIAADVPKKFGMTFDINNPRAEAWLRNNSSQLITGILKPEQRSAIQTVLQAGMQAGKNPRSVALDIVGRIAENGRRGGGIIGLTNQQAGYVLNARDELLNLDSHYFTRKLRDRRFDSLVKKSIKDGKPLDQVTVNRITDRYSDRLLKHRGDMIGRTEVLKALNEANDEALRQVIDEGLAPANAALRVWRHSFSPNERPGHLAMNGWERGINQPFVNPVTGIALMHPGDGPASEVIACRCYIEHRIDFVAVELAA